MELENVQPKTLETIKGMIKKLKILACANEEKASSEWRKSQGALLLVKRLKKENAALQDQNQKLTEENARLREQTNAKSHRNWRLGS